MPDEDWMRLADYVIARRVELGLRDRRTLAAATGVTDRTLAKLEHGQRVSASTLGLIEVRLGWTPGSCRRILAGREPAGGPSAASEDSDGSPAGREDSYDDPTLRHLASTPGLPPDVVRGLIALARNWRQGDADGTTGLSERRA